MSSVAAMMGITSSISGGGATVDTAFVFTVTTTSTNEVFSIPCVNIGTFNATINWGDGTNDSTIIAYNDAALAHTYTTAGDHQIRITGQFPNVRFFDDTVQRVKVKSVDNVGAVGWTTFGNAFYACSNMTSFTAGAGTNTSSVTDTRSMLRNCTSLTSCDVSNFDTSSVTRADSMFFSCSSLTSLDVSNFDTSSMTQMDNMFRGMSLVTDIVGVEDFDITGLGSGALSNFMRDTTLPTSRYNALLDNWEDQASNQTVTAQVSAHFGNSKYTANSPAATARADLTNANVHGWSIIDGGTA